MSFKFDKIPVCVFTEPLLIIVFKYFIYVRSVLNVRLLNVSRFKIHDLVNCIQLFRNVYRELENIRLYFRFVSSEDDIIYLNFF